MSVEDHLFLDETNCYYVFKVLSKKTNHPTLADLSRRLIDRDLFKYIDFDQETSDKLQALLIEKGYDPKYYLGSDSMTQRPYIPYRLNNEDNLISILIRDESVAEITKVSPIVEAMADAKLKEDNKIFTIKEIFDEL